MKYPNIHTRLHGSAWMVLPTTFEAMARGLSAAEAQSTPVPAAFFDAGSEAGIPWEYQVIDRAALIPVRGIMGKHLSGMEMMCGGCSIDAIEADLAMAMADPAVDRIILRMDTPGGTVTGTPELAATIRAAAQQGTKDIIAFTDSLSASAGYYIASQAHAILLTPSANVGSIGVIMSLATYREAFERAGIAYTVISTGVFKTIGHPALDITDAQRDYLEELVADDLADFRAAVIAGRGSEADIDPAAFEAKIYRGRKAVAAGLADAVVPSLSAALTYEF